MTAGQSLDHAKWRASFPESTGKANNITGFFGIFLLHQARLAGIAGQGD